MRIDDLDAQILTSRRSLSMPDHEYGERKFMPMVANPQLRASFRVSLPGGAAIATAWPCSRSQRA
ncbi:hypothetical protein WJ969_00445 [Achromobacter xylosoxidans]